jgi:hypothetical protein
MTDPEPTMPPSQSSEGYINEEEVKAALLALPRLRATVSAPDASLLKTAPEFRDATREQLERELLRYNIRL